jgi:hypothetical protein
VNITGMNLEDFLTCDFSTGCFICLAIFIAFCLVHRVTKDLGKVGEIVTDPRRHGHSFFL